MGNAEIKKEKLKNHADKATVPVEVWWYAFVVWTKLSRYIARAVKRYSRIHSVIKSIFVFSQR